MALVANAAGLGRLNVLSNLGEPFRAEIELISTTTEELETLTAVIASDEAYSAQGISRLSIHNDIQVALSKSGKPKLVLSSAKAVSDPYLDMLIQLDWASGRLQREYTILLDPPEYQSATASVPDVPVIQPEATLPTPEPIVQAEAIQPESLPLAPIGQEVPTLKPVPTIKPMDTQQLPTVGAKSEAEIQAEINRIEMEAKSRYGAQSETMSATPEPFAMPAPVREPVAAAPASKHRTVSGDNLSKIARRLNVSGVSLNQMLVGLYEYNKDAFVNGNMNRLKVGKVIKLPTKEELLSVSRSKANQTVVVHTENWQSYRQAVAGNASPSISVVDDKQSESGDITAFEPEKPIEAKETKDVVKLSKSEDAGATADSGISVSDKEKEDDIAKDKALKEAEDRTAAVEKQIEDMQKLLKMKNDEMAELEQKAAANNAEKEVESGEGFVDLGESEQPATTSPEMPEKEKPVVETPKPKPAAPMPVAEEPTIWEKITDVVSLPILTGLGAILLLLFGLLFFRNKRKKDLENFERGILTSGGLRANTVFGNTTGDTSATDTSFLTDFAQTTDGAVMDANEVDPIAEAEVYMAYGREAQAEEILKEAIKKEPNRHELHLKLLEIYQDRKDNAAFETLASELYTTLGDEDPTWQKVAEMGRVLEPSNPLYTQDDLPETQTVMEESVVDDVEATANTGVGALESGVEKLGDAADDLKDDIVEGANTIADKADSAGDAAMAKAAGVAGLAGAAVSATGSRIESIVRHEPKPEPEELPDLDFSTDEVEPEEVSINVEDVSEIEISASGSSEAEVDDPQLQDFDLSGISLEIEEDTKQAVESVDDADVDLNEPEITLGDVDELPGEEMLTSANEESLDDNEVEIKLNLVSAYIDMDDKEGARELLEEVIKEGSDEQVMRAEMMKDSIA